MLSLTALSAMVLKLQWREQGNKTHRSHCIEEGYETPFFPQIN